MINMRAICFSHLFTSLILSILKKQDFIVGQMTCSENWSTFEETGEILYPKNGLLRMTVSGQDCAANCYINVNCREYIYNPTDQSCLLVEFGQRPEPDTSYPSTPKNIYHRFTKPGVTGESWQEGLNGWCPTEDGYKLLGGGSGPCVKFFTDERTWSDANWICTSYSPTSRLAILDTQNKFQLVKSAGSAINNRFSSSVYFGLSDHGGNGFRWVDGSTLSYTNWGNIGPAQVRCGAMFRFQNWKWYAVGCGNKNHYVCEVTRQIEK